MTYPKTAEEYGSKDYWDLRFSEELDYDWLTSYNAYQNLLENHIQKSDAILILGCGNSKMSYNIYNSGYQNITNIDYSEAVISKMATRYRDCEFMTWQTMDLRSMDFPKEHFNVIIEKATLDVFFVSEKDPWHISMETSTIIHKIISQVSNMLKNGGKFISITWAQPHFRKKILCKPCFDWSVDVHKFGDGLEYFMYVMTKGEKLVQCPCEVPPQFDLPTQAQSECEEDILIQFMNMNV